MRHIPVDPDAPLVLRTEIDPALDQIESGNYRFRIKVLVQNLSDIPAESPLVLFPKFGLDIRAYPPMTIEPIASGPQKLLVCKSLSSTQIGAQGNAEVCGILASYNRTTGRFAFTPNAYHRAGEDMGNFSIACATGAANFPLRRVKLAVLASDLQAVIDAFFAKNGGSKSRLPAAGEDNPPIAMSA